MIEQLLTGLPVNSISLDNGSEFANFHQLEQKLHSRVSFAEPHKLWQRGTNENTNDLIRFFFPKGLTSSQSRTKISALLSSFSMIVLESVLLLKSFAIKCCTCLTICPLALSRRHRISSFKRSGS